MQSIVEKTQKELVDHGLVKKGDDIGITFGTLDMSGPGRTDVLKLWRIR